MLYFDGAGVLKPVLVLCAWTTAGTALLGLDAWRHHRTAVRGGAQDEREVMDTRGRQLVRTTTNARGEYAVTGLPEGYISVVVSHPGRDPLVHRKLLQSGAAVRADFTLRDRRHGTSTGDGAHRPASGVTRESVPAAPTGFPQ
ncbi:carboxypeptidase-like regulatory domain-containing protein [Streptomyces sp. NPDC004542]|uniref:carboxypeptidase-like regulatory domain-containing protein n=1 Tax=Streptomyces sp. NPDC004542 TaxID=3154281 RepID=UPI0033B54E0C